jgi:uncharacterized protein
MDGQMANNLELHRPCLVAAWPGMGHVAINAGYYLAAKLGTHVVAEVAPQGLFDVQHVEVKDGLIQSSQWPRSRFFLWHDPAGQQDLLVFIGEDQPPVGKYAFCHKLIEFVQALGVERVYTFAALATDMRPDQDSRVFAAAVDKGSLRQLRSLNLRIIEDGYIGGLNGVLLGIAAESGLRGACLMGEIPAVLSQLPFPKASLAVLEQFAAMVDLQLDFSELSEQAHAVDEQLSELMENIEKTVERITGHEPETWQAEPTAEEPLGPVEARHIERLFSQAQKHRSRAYELKRELDRLGIFQDYEDRFLDLFRKPGQGRSP